MLLPSQDKHTIPAALFATPIKKATKDVDIQFIIVRVPRYWIIIVSQSVREGEIRMGWVGVSYTAISVLRHPRG